MVVETGFSKSSGDKVNESVILEPKTNVVLVEKWFVTGILHSWLVALKLNKS